MEALEVFDQVLQNISDKCNPRPHKRLKFVNRNVLELSQLEQKLYEYFQVNVNPKQLQDLLKCLNGVNGESRICEYLVALIQHSEERIDRHVDLFKEVLNVLKKAKELKCGDQILEEVAEKCSLMLYDSFHFLCDVKRMLAEVAQVYQVPYYYETEAGNIRLRSSMLSTYKNLNTIIDDLQTLNEALWFVRHYESLANV